jgi:hypothetical protein
MILEASGRSNIHLGEEKQIGVQQCMTQLTLFLISILCNISNGDHSSTELGMLFNIPSSVVKTFQAQSINLKDVFRQGIKRSRSVCARLCACVRACVPRVCVCMFYVYSSTRGSMTRENVCVCVCAYTHAYIHIHAYILCVVTPKDIMARLPRTFWSLSQSRHTDFCTSYADVLMIFCSLMT